MHSDSVSSDTIFPVAHAGFGIHTWRLATGKGQSLACGP